MTCVTPAPIRRVLESAGISSLLWAPNFRGDTGQGGSRITIKQIILKGL